MSHGARLTHGLTCVCAHDLGPIGCLWSKVLSRSAMNGGGGAGGLWSKGADARFDDKRVLGES